MRILAIGDPHGNLDKIKKITLKNVDLILLTGDIGKADLARKIFFENQKRKQQGLLEVEETLKDVKAMHYEIHNSTISLLKYLSKYAKVYSIEGNVGIPNEFDIKKINKKLKINLPITKNYINKMKNIYIVKNSLRKINNLKIGFLEYFLDKSWVEEFKPKDYNEIIEKAKSCVGLDLEEVGALVNVDDEKLIQKIHQAAHEVKMAIYGPRLVLFAPLYVSSFCVNDCE
ncbi:MAG: metallophosphoesterase, partial [Candidatus Pacearchaeota archaeon]